MSLVQVLSCYTNNGYSRAIYHFKFAKPFFGRTILVNCNITRMYKSIIKPLGKQGLNNNTGAFRKLVEAHQEMVNGYAVRLLCDWEEARDITQEIFIRIWKHLQPYDPDKKFTTWMFAITSNLCLDKNEEDFCDEKFLEYFE